MPVNCFGPGPELGPGHDWAWGPFGPGAQHGPGPNVIGPGPESHLINFESGTFV